MSAISVIEYCGFGDVTHQVAYSHSWIWQVVAKRGVLDATDDRCCSATAGLPAWRRMGVYVNGVTTFTYCCLKHCNSWTLVTL